MNDAECQIHDIQWSSEERGTNCPACENEEKISKLVLLLRGCADYVPEILKEKIQATLKEMRDKR